MVFQGQGFRSPIVLWFNNDFSTLVLVTNPPEFQAIETLAGWSKGF